MGSFPQQYGDFVSSTSTGAGNGSSGISYPQPSLWINSANTTLMASTIRIELVAFDYSTPINVFGLLSTASGTVDEFMTVGLNSYYDVNNTGVAGAGIQLLDADWTGLASGAVPGNLSYVNNNGDQLFSVSWILDVTRSQTGTTAKSATVGGQLMAGAPAPAAAALLGLGLLGVGFLRRRVK